MYFKILSDSACDLPDDLIKKHQIDIIPFYISFENDHYIKEKEEIDRPTFYSKLYHTYPKTSLPSVHDYINKFQPYAEKGEHLLCINITSKFSGSHQAALTAKKEILEKYPSASITVIDSQLCSASQGLLVLEAVRMRDAGFTLEKTAERLQQIIPTGRMMFTIGKLDHLQKGGRIGKVTALAGSILNLKPLIVLKDGEVFPYGTVRGRKKALRKIIDMVKEHFKTIKENIKDYAFCVERGDCIDDARILKEGIEDKLNISIEYPCFPLGVTIGSYSGPDPVGVAFLKKYDKITV